MFTVQINVAQYKHAVMPLGSLGIDTQTLGLSKEVKNFVLA